MERLYVAFYDVSVLTIQTRTMHTDRTLFLRARSEKKKEHERLILNC
jgi:hypothetical protein